MLTFPSHAQAPSTSAQPLLKSSSPAVGLPEPTTVSNQSPVADASRALKAWIERRSATLAIATFLSLTSALTPISLLPTLPLIAAVCLPILMLP